MDKMTPFPFLNSTAVHTIDLVHEYILSDQQPDMKHAHIKISLDLGNPMAKGYLDWIEEKKDSPPSEVVSELSAECNAHLDSLIADKKYEQISTLFPHLKSPATRKLAENWLAIITDDKKLVELALADAKEILLKFKQEKKNPPDNLEEIDQKENKVTELVAKFENLEIDQGKRSALSTPPSYASITAKRMAPQNGNLPKVADISPENLETKGRELFNSKKYPYDPAEGAAKIEEVSAKRVEEDGLEDWVMVEKSDQEAAASPIKTQTMKYSEACKKNRVVVPLEKNIFEDDKVGKLDKERALDGLYSPKNLSYHGRKEYFPPMVQPKTEKSEKQAALNSKGTYGWPKDESPVKSGPAMKESFKTWLANQTSSSMPKEKSSLTFPTPRNPPKAVGSSSGLDLIKSKYSSEPAMVSPPPLPPSPPVSWLTDQDFSIGDMDPKNVFNILLLGETGVGKTTFINSFANYVKYNSMDEALEETPVILMKSSFSITNVKTKDEKMVMKQKLITVEANCEQGRKSSKNEQFTEGGRSRTQEPLLHQIKWEENGAAKMLRIIDTPGVNDTRGARQDESNFGKILELVRKIGNLSAICILLKPNESKLSLGFRNCLDNVLVKLHRSATKNILFCFTNTRSTLYRPGDTIAVLSHYLEDLEKSSGVMIKANKSNIFCFDNDCFRYMCTLMNLPLAKGENTHATLSAGWVHNVHESKKLLNKIQGLLAHQVEDTVNINNTRRLLVALARPLTEIAQNQIVNRRLMETKIKEIQKLKEKGAELGSIMEQKQIVIYRRQLPQPRTICTASKCTEMMQESDGQYYPVSKKICHDNCFISTIIPLTIGDPSLQQCRWFSDKTGNCMECGCHWKVHMHMTYELIRREETVASQEEKDQFHACKNDEQRAEMVLEYLKLQLANIQSEYALIKEASFEFSAFLKFNSVKAGVDPYFDYLNHLIEVEEKKAKHGGNKLLVIDLKVMLKEYNKGVAHDMEEMKEGRKVSLTSEELRRKIENLSKMKLSGSLIADIVKEATSAKQ